MFRVQPPELPLELLLDPPLELALPPPHSLAQVDALQVMSAVPALLQSVVKLETHIPRQLLSEQSHLDSHERNAEHEDSAVENCEPHALCSQEMHPVL